VTAKHVPALPVVYARRARKDLVAVWDWNAETYGPDHADKYVDLLQSSIDALSATYSKGRPVPSRPQLRYIRIGKRTRGHGHLAVYHVLEDAVSVLHVFHTAQDWLTKLAEEEPVD
jgi:plasmid stabilization system protein ParE